MKMQIFTRRDVIKVLGLGALYLVTGASFPDSEKRRHIITLSFDDGYEKSSIKTAEIYEKYGLSASINVIATGYIKRLGSDSKLSKGDFKFWNELKSRGHEIMPHSYEHINLGMVSFEEARSLILKCLDIFKNELSGFVPEKSIYNFAYNASTPEIEKWLATQVRAFRTSGGCINPLPYRSMTKLTCGSHGPQNIDNHLEETINNFIEGDSGWLIYNTHGLDDEGWGPVSSSFLDELLHRLTKSETVKVLSVTQALDHATRHK